MSKNAAKPAAKPASRMCPACNGRGCIPGKTPGSWTRCPECRGEGRVVPREKSEAKTSTTTSEPKSKE